MVTRRDLRARPIALITVAAASLIWILYAGGTGSETGVSAAAAHDAGGADAQTALVTAAAEGPPRALARARLQSPAPWLEPVGAREDNGFTPHRASFSLTFRNQVSPYQLMSVFLMPGERLDLGVADPDGRSFHAEAQEGLIESRGDAQWSWLAPEQPGRYLLRVHDTGRSGEIVTLNAFVKVPYDGSEWLNGYRIGSYGPGTDARNQPPRGFIEVTEENRGSWISPHFRLEQFLCKQESAYPKYVLVQEALLLKLERVLEQVNANGIEAPTFQIMSAFRTPFYNRAIGNTTTYSRHLFGDAADVFIDRSGDGWMDDLTGSGTVDQRDAQVIYDLVEELHRDDRHFHASFNGGMGLYAPRAGVHPPFIHVDTRGQRARW